MCQNQTQLFVILSLAFNLITIKVLFTVSVGAFRKHPNYVTRAVKDKSLLALHEMAKLDGIGLSQA